MPPVAPPYLVRNAPAIARWHCPTQSETRYLGYKYPEPKCSVVLDAIFDESTASAFLKLRVPIALKGHRGQTTLYLFIPPEAISRLRRTDRAAAIPHPVASVFVQNQLSPSDGDIVGLEIELGGSATATAVGPTGVVPSPRPRYERVLFLLRSLARATRLTIYLPARLVSSADALDALCATACAGHLTSTREESSLQRLYAGKGGEPLPAADDESDSPPSYDELAPSSPSSSGPQAKTRKVGEDLQEWRRKVETQLEILARRVEHLTEPEPSPVIYARETQLSDLQKQLDSLRAEVRRSQQGFEWRLEDIETRFEERLETAKEELREELVAEADLGSRLDELMEGERSEIADEMDERINDRILDIKQELSRHVNEEMQTVEETIKDDLRKALEV